ncbi:MULTISPECIES: hypothetical protein [unclassified Sphingomonas]|uniref:hypothetical protein n=1 Tax=unclassified Sphingomonas TaxID=196159 RepID=UPI001D12E058|nr:MULTISPECIES: hypothetical protein [unclassified Sphingomonas]MCC2979547.1 hypothetical protein [Sphingomonas sp. IC4-52]MCD2315224.1 hypothetical protein [Sphingomonas sp. IC-11]
MAENPRTTTARDHDDKDVIEGMIPGGEAQTGTSGGALARDVGSRDDMHQVDDPDGTTRPTKQADIDAGQAYRSDRRTND